MGNDTRCPHGRQMAIAEGCDACIDAFFGSQAARAMVREYLRSVLQKHEARDFRMGPYDPDFLRSQDDPHGQ